jgi:hypothetical protein
MIAPANWDGLWLKYELTPSDDSALKQLVAAQIEQYYPNATAKKLAKPR